MEEILASIRRIISDEVAEPATASAPVAPPAPVPPVSRPMSASARSIPAREMTGRETLVRDPLPRESIVRETSPRPVAPRETSLREPIPARPAADSRPPLGDSTNGATALGRPGLASPATLRPRPADAFASASAPVSRAVPPSADVSPSYGATAPALRAAPTPVYAPSGRAPALDPFAPRARALAVATLPVEPLTEDAVEAFETAKPAAYPTPAPSEDALDTPIKSVLLDLALVEQAVQAELANVAREPARTSRDAVAAQQRPDDPPQHRPVESLVEATPAAEIADMQLQVRTKQDAAEPAYPVSIDNEAVAASAEPAEASPAKAADVAQAGAKAAPSLPRAFVPSFRAESRLAESRVGAVARPAATSETAANGEVPRERLVSTPANNAVTAAFGSLHRTVTPTPRTVDDLVTDALRPMLKTWLDENLPTIVERLVKAEIERVSREGR